MLFSGSVLWQIEGREDFLFPSLQGDKSCHQFNQSELPYLPRSNFLPWKPSNASPRGNSRAPWRAWWRCLGPGCSAAFQQEPELRALVFLECRRGLAGAMVRWNGKHAIPCSAWCWVTLRGCVTFLGYWLNDSGLDEEDLNSRELPACWQRDVSSTCLHIDLRTLLDWRVHIPKVSTPEPRHDLCTTSPASVALVYFHSGCHRNSSLIPNLCFFCHCYFSVVIKHITHSVSGLKSQSMEQAQAINWWQREPGLHGCICPGDQTEDKTAAWPSYAAEN